MIVRDIELTPHLVETHCDCGGDLQLLYSSGYVYGRGHDPSENTWHYRCKECGAEYDVHFPPSELKVLSFKDKDGRTVFEISFDDLDRMGDILWSC